MIAGSLDDNLVAGVGQPVEGAVAEGGIVEETEPFLHGPIGCDDETGDPVTADYELVQISRLLGCKAMEAIIESVDEFYSENLAQEVMKGLREAASRGFWMAPYVPFGYRRVYVRDGAKKRPRLEVDEDKAAVVRRIFRLTLQGRSPVEIIRILNDEGIASPREKLWLKTTVQKVLVNESYTGTLIWGRSSKDGTPHVRVNGAFPALVTMRDFRQVAEVLQSRAPNRIHPRRATSPYLLSGLAKCEPCRKALTAAEAKSGKYSYYVCQSLLKRGRRSCNTPRLNAKYFEGLIVGSIRDNILTESNITDLVRIANEEMDDVAKDQRKALRTIRRELGDVKRRLARIWEVIETSKSTSTMPQNGWRNSGKERRNSRLLKRRPKTI